MSWIRETVKTIHLLVLLFVCGIGFYNVSVVSQKEPSTAVKQEDQIGALTVVPNDEQEQDDGVLIMDSEDEIGIENVEPFIATNEWQKIKPGQAVPRGLHMRLNIQTGEREAKLMAEEASSSTDHDQENNGDSQRITDKLDFEDLKNAVKSMKSEKFKSVDMDTLQKEKDFRSYEELKADLEKVNADIKTDAEVISELVEQFQTVSQTQQDVTPLLEQLEYYLHQIDNALLFCDLGAMPMLLRCLNNSLDTVRSGAALTLGSALQSNPKVQIVAIENGAMHEVLRLLALDTSLTVKKRAMYALSTMIRHFPFAQKRFLELGGLSVLGKLFESKSTEGLQVRAITLLADLVKEKSLHEEHTNPEDSTQKERLRQYQEVRLEEAMVQSGWCPLFPSLLQLGEHDSREKVLVAMEIVQPLCDTVFRHSVPVLKSLQAEYSRLVRLEQEDSSDDGEDDGFFTGLVSTIENLLTKLSVRDEL